MAEGWLGWRIENSPAPWKRKYCLFRTCLCVVAVPSCVRWALMFLLPLLQILITRQGQKLTRCTYLPGGWRSNMAVDGSNMAVDDVIFCKRTTKQALMLSHTYHFGQSQGVRRTSRCILWCSQRGFDASLPVNSTILPSSRSMCVPGIEDIFPNYCPLNLLPPVHPSTHAV